jgi:N-acetylglucosaminyl-diphospho-decaprenol L-rhamnosyltransferase
MRLCIVIVNYRTPQLTVDCLRSLEDQVRRRGDARVVVVDGASPDDSVALIGRALDDQGWHGWVDLMPLDVNGGFAYGNNAAIHPALEAEAPPDFVLLLNPDTIVLPGALTHLVDFMERHPRAGIAGSRLENRDGTARFSAFRFASPLGELESMLRLGPVSRLLRRYLVNPPIRTEEHRTDWVAGASMIVRRQVFVDIGLLDPGYFLYFEESDFCLRAARAGWECWYVPQSRVVHLVGQSSGVTGAGRTERRTPPYWFASRRRYFRKNHGLAGALAADACWLSGYALWTLRSWVTRRARIDPPCLGRDFIRWTYFPRRTP